MAEHLCRLGRHLGRAGGRHGADRRGMVGGLFDRAALRGGHVMNRALYVGGFSHPEYQRIGFRLSDRRPLRRDHAAVLEPHRRAWRLVSTSTQRLDFTPTSDDV